MKRRQRTLSRRDCSLNCNAPSRVEDRANGSPHILRIQNREVVDQYDITVRLVPRILAKAFPPVALRPTNGASGYHALFFTRSEQFGAPSGSQLSSEHQQRATRLINFRLR